MSPSRRLAPFAPLALAAAVLAGCGGRADRYDPARMDLKPTPARLSDARHTGAFFSGSAVSPGPELPPLDPAHEKTIQLDVVSRIIEIAPGVQYRAWTFGGQVPGPLVHVRVGDRIHFSMTNRSDETLPGAPSFSAMPMMHSIDFHAAMVSPTDKYRSIAPGQTIAFDWTPNYPGVFMYHCGTPMILEHIASGMYGAVVVEPREGWPTKVDRQYVIVQSEFYATPDPDHHQVDGQDLYVLDTQNLRRKQSTYTVFNGRYNGFVDHPLAARPGERVRLYVLNAGPSNTSSFHVVGEIFDRVWLDGNPDNQMRGMQTVLLGSSGSVAVEFVVPESGKYVFVDHHFANASQGAIGVLDATGNPGPDQTIEHHNIPATATPTDPDALAGKLQFESKCLACHTWGKGPKIGPDLSGVSRRRTELWITHWLESPEKMLAADDTAKALLGRYHIPMPNQQLSAKEIRGLIRYFQWADAGGPAARPGAGE